MEHRLRGLSDKTTYLTIDEAADYLAVSHHTLRKWHREKYGPASARIAGRSYYRVADLDAFIDSLFAESDTSNAHRS